MKTSQILLPKQDKAKKIPIIILMMRWHGFKRCKHRLSADIGAKSAAQIQKQITEHTILVAKTIKDKGIAEIKIAISGLGPKAAKRWGQSQGIKNISLQGSGQLGERMRKELAKLHHKQNLNSEFKQATIFIGTDLPTLSHMDLLQALKALQSKDLVIGPANDGGYWLIGLSENLIRTKCLWPFYGIPWGTNDVLNETLKRARKKKVKYELLIEQNDLDKVSDLLPWQNNLIIN